ncbi:hypothetical protein Gotur_008357 [Gossypium turneri]
MICIDNLEWMRNDDYSLSRFQAQANVVSLIYGAKTQFCEKSMFDNLCERRAAFLLEFRNEELVIAVGWNSNCLVGSKASPKQKSAVKDYSFCWKFIVFLRNDWKVLDVVRGLVASAMVFAIQIYVVDRGGPLFFSMYFPLQTLLAALIAAVTLGEEFYLGGVVGAALIIAGLYLVILGKSEESKYLSENKPIYSVSENNDMESTFIRPLLGNKLQS